VTVDCALSKEHLPKKGEWEAAVKRVEDAGGIRVQSKNPYRDFSGVTFEDLDRY
jgi:hypothetical protein